MSVVSVPNICDARGHQCPIPVLKASKALAQLATGQQLTLLATDPMAKIDVPHMCNEQGYRLISSDSGKDDVLTFLIEKTWALLTTYSSEGRNLGNGITNAVTGTLLALAGEKA